MFDPTDQLDGAVNELRGWLAAQVRQARGSIGRLVPERLRPKLQGTAEAAPRAERAADRGPAPSPGGAAPVVLVGGGELSDEVTLGLLHASGGRRARIRILAGFELDFAQAARRHARQFARFGAVDVATGAVTTRVQADDEVRAVTFRDAELIVLAADDARHAALMLADSAVLAAIREARSRGATVALAGAAVALAGTWLPEATSEPGEAFVPGLDLLDRFLCAGAVAPGAKLSSFLDAVVRLPAGADRALWLERGAAARVGPEGVEVWGDGFALALDVAELRAALAFDGTVLGASLTPVPPGHRLDVERLAATRVESAPARARGAR